MSGPPVRRMSRALGQPVRRKEDPRLLTGRGKYAADFRLPGMLHAAVLRSPHAHARVRGIRTEAALGLRGVAAVITAQDLGDIGRIPVRLGPRPSIVACLQPPLAREKVRYVGEPVAFIVAASRYVAEDALELVEVDYEPLPTVADARRAIEPGAPVLHEAIGGNVVATLDTKRGDAEAALAAAHTRVRERFAVQRHTGVPMLLNTSFNENEPIVHQPSEALDCFLRTRMDVLVLGNQVVTKGESRRGGPDLQVRPTPGQSPGRQEPPDLKVRRSTV